MKSLNICKIKIKKFYKYVLDKNEIFVFLTRVNNIKFLL